MEPKAARLLSARRGPIRNPCPREQRIIRCSVGLSGQAAPDCVQSVIGLLYKIWPAAQPTYRMLGLSTAPPEVSVAFPYPEERRLRSYLAVRIGVPWAATRGLLAPLVKTAPSAVPLHTSHLSVCSPKARPLPASCLPSRVPLSGLEVPSPELRTSTEATVAQRLLCSQAVTLRTLAQSW